MDSVLFPRSRIGKRKVHIIGCGSLGSKCAEILFKKGVDSLVLWDGDVVEERNLYNQRFLPEQVGLPKVMAIPSYLSRFDKVRAERITAYETFITENPGGTGILGGIVIMCVDSMRERKKVWTAIKQTNEIAGSNTLQQVSLVIDGRISLFGGKVYGFSPLNPWHAHCYGGEEHLHDDPPGLVEGACKTEFPMPEQSDVAVHHMMWRLTEWLHLENGRVAPYLNFFAWSMLPQYQDAREYWDEKDMGAHLKA